MFPIILIVTFASLLAVCFAGFVIALRSKPSNDNLGIPSVFMGAVFGGLLIAIVALWPTLYFNSIAEVARMEAFYHDTLSAYEYTVTATGDIEITNAEAGLIDIAYQEQGAATSERLRELRDRIEWYNAKLRYFERFNSLYIADPFLADLPDDLAPIKITVDGVEQ
jgi:hypothetical protein